MVATGTWENEDMSNTLGYWLAAPGWDDFPGDKMT
jgi:hypothetical protein